MTIQAGRYKAHAVSGSMQFGMSAKGNEQISVDLLLPTGEMVTTFLSFSDAARPYSEDRLVALGWAGIGHELDEAELNREVDVDVSYQDYQGKQQMRVDIVPGGGRVKMKTTLDEAQKKAFLQRLTGISKSAPKLDF